MISSVAAEQLERQHLQCNATGEVSEYQSIARVSNWDAAQSATRIAKCYIE